MAIETMIIFIAIVLVAAVAAGMLIRQSGLLQQRAVSVSDEARERMITGVEVISIISHTDIDNQTLNDLELLVRLNPGSNPIQLRDLSLMITTPTYSESATLMHSTIPKLFNDINIANVPNSTFSNGTEWMTIANIEIDNKKDTGINTEKVRLLVNGSNNSEVLQFNLSFASYEDDPELEKMGIIVPGETFNVDLETDLSNISGSGVVIDLTDLPIRHSVSGDVYGFVSIHGTAMYNNSLIGLTAIVTSNPTRDDCDFDNLVPNKRFCLITRVGANDDTKMERGELYSFRFKVKNEQVLIPEELFEIKLIPKGGSIEFVSMVTPAVLVLETTTLWG
jgi:archaellin